MSQIKKATLAGLVAIIFWSTLPVVSVFTKNIPPFFSLSVAYFIATIIYISLWYYKYSNADSTIKLKSLKDTHKKSVSKPNRLLNILIAIRQPISYTVITVLGVFGANSTFLFAMQNGDPMVSYLAINLWPVLSLFLAAFLYKDKLNFLHYIGTILCFIGVIFISIKDGLPDLASAKFFGILMALANAVIWSIFSVLTRRFSNVSSDAIGLPLAIVCLLTFTAHYYLESSVSNISFYEALALIYMGIAPWGMAYTLWGYALRFGDIKVIIILGYLMPLLGIIWLTGLGYSEVNISIIIATILIIGGTSIGSLKLFFK